MVYGCSGFFCERTAQFLSQYLKDHWSTGIGVPLSRLGRIPYTAHMVALILAFAIGFLALSGSDTHSFLIAGVSCIIFIGAAFVHSVLHKRRELQNGKLSSDTYFIMYRYNLWKKEIVCYGN